MKIHVGCIYNDRIGYVQFFAGYTADSFERDKQLWLADQIIDDGEPVYESIEDFIARNGFRWQYSQEELQLADRIGQFYTQTISHVKVKSEDRDVWDLLEYDDETMVSVDHALDEFRGDPDLGSEEFRAMVKAASEAYIIFLMRDG